MQLDKERGYVARQLRFELATAAYGVTTSYQVYNDDDSQIKRAVEVFPIAENHARREAAILRSSQEPSL